MHVTDPGLSYSLLLTQLGLVPVHLMLTERTCTRRQDRRWRGSSLGDPDTNPGSVAALCLSHRLLFAPYAGLRTKRSITDWDLCRAAPRTTGRRSSLFAGRIPSRAPPDTGPEQALPGAAPDTKTRRGASGLCLSDARSPPAQAVTARPSPRCQTALRVQSC